ncbi:hypothetical protein HYN69_11925 [Gemmobacter aquarius]|uniref:HdeA/HdeB family protein n=2 Tax=Paragemmobacter aquarius TaxID=2169400 RepID=A0A2S0UMT5_9RHOB|nr:hypothetical protein HYN69_11925 [Gemmobacter aquarius]
MRVSICSLLLIASVTLPVAARADSLDCKKIAWHAQLVMTVRQMDGDINKAFDMVTKEAWPLGREMVREAYELPIMSAAERRRSLSTPSKSFSNEWGRRCLAGELN